MHVSENIYRVGLISAGRRGLELAALCQRLPNLQLVAVADHRPQQLARAASELGDIACYPNYEEMLADQRPDVVIVATLGMNHHDPTVAAARNGAKAIYVEKPLETSLAKCDAMIAACQESGTKLAVGHQRRWWPEYKAVRDAIRMGAVGKLIHGYLYWSTGRVGSMGTHIFDTLNLLVGSDATWVSGRLDPSSQPWPQWPDILDPGAMGFIVYGNGVRIAVDVMEDVRQPIDLLLYGARGRLHVLEDARKVSYWAREQEAEDAYAGFVSLSPHPFQPPSPPADWDAHGVVEGLIELIACIEQDRESSSNGAHARHALEIIVAFHLSSRNNMQPVHLPLSGDALAVDLSFR
jgi:UDP-N-acetyl-2-amino-2-deoxyglucuronate dehydrogenase